MPPTWKLINTLPNREKCGSEKNQDVYQILNYCSNEKKHKAENIVVQNKNRNIAEIYVNSYKICTSEKIEFTFLRLVAL